MSCAGPRSLAEGSLALDRRVRVLRQMGQLDEAQAAVDQALRIDPDAGVAYALAAGISLDRGDRMAAEQLAECAGELEPGGLLVLVAKAEVALAAGDRELARAAVERRRQDDQGQSLRGLPRRSRSARGSTCRIGR